MKTQRVVARLKETAGELNPERLKAAVEGNDWIPNPQRLKTWKSQITKRYPRAQIMEDHTGALVAKNRVKASETITVGKYARDIAPWVMDKETYDSYAKDILG